MRINCVLIAGGQWHDFDHARLELLKLLAEHPSVRVRVFEDYRCLEALQQADMLITYTCDVVPALEEQEALRDFLRQGGRWIALHGTNSILRFLDDGRIDTPRWAPLFMETLGSMFLAHPPIGPFVVSTTERPHPLTEGIEAFEVVDEMYLTETHGDLDVLLDTHFEGKAGRFVHNTWASGRHPVMYLKPLGHGSVLYLTLGHCRGHYDLQPLQDFYPHVERGAWELPVYHELLRRSLRWAMKQL